MRIPPGATSFTPQAGPLNGGSFKGTAHRHTVRPDGGKDYLLMYTIRGSGLYTDEAGHFRSRSHCVTVYPRGVAQDYRRAPESRSWEMLFAHFTPPASWLPLLNWPTALPGLHFLEIESPVLRRRLPARLLDMIRLHRSSEPRREEFALNALEEVLLWCDSINPARKLGGYDLRVRRAMDYLTERYAENYSEEKLGRAVGLSGSRLRHLFRQQVGQGPREFQEQERMRRARELLALSSLNIGEIADALGFENPFYFTLRFKKSHGESPRAFRQRVMGG